jgi:hypothetical protein
MGLSKKSVLKKFRAVEHALQRRDQTSAGCAISEICLNPPTLELTRQEQKVCDAGHTAVAIVNAAKLPVC